MLFFTPSIQHASISTRSDDEGDVASDDSLFRLLLPIWWEIKPFMPAPTEFGKSVLNKLSSDPTLNSERDSHLFYTS